MKSSNGVLLFVGKEYISKKEAEAKAMTLSLLEKAVDICSRRHNFSPTRVEFRVGEMKDFAEALERLSITGVEKTGLPTGHIFVPTESADES